LARVLGVGHDLDHTCLIGTYASRSYALSYARIVDIPTALTLALELADLADGITTKRFRAHDLHVTTKPDLTPVSEADEAVERAIRAELSKFDGHTVLGEEFGHDADADAEFRWIIDPIDGTKNYVRGVPIWATLIGVEQQG